MNEYAETTATNETAAVGMGGQGDTISAADLFTPEETGAGNQTDSNVQADAPAREKTDERRFTSDDMSRAVTNRLKQERKGAAYQLGRELLDEYMRTNNVNEADALAKIREERINAKAAAFKADPEKGFRELMQQREQRAEPEEDTRTPEAHAERLYNSIVADMQSGKVPDGFDLEAHMADRENARQFVELYEAFGMEKACAYAMRMSAPATTKTEQNRALPKPIATNNAYNPQNIDYMAMSSKEFAELERKMKKARAEGKRVI